MIYTVTFNPSLDYIVTVDKFKEGVVNRTKEELIYPGGKGINVSIVLSNLGLKSTALGFIAGFTGEEIVTRLSKLGCNADFIKVSKGISRINLKLRSDKETEINGIGPSIGAQELQKLYLKIDTLKEGDILVLAGSVPSSLPDSIYRDIMERIAARNIKTVVDATQQLLTKVLKYKPFLIKPNNHELGEIFGVTIKDKKEVAHYAMKLKEMGAQNVLVSMAGEGAVLITEDGTVYESSSPKGRVVNSVGAGDSMVAGFIAGYVNSGDYKEALKMGIATGSASAFKNELANKQDVEAILKTHTFGF